MNEKQKHWKKIQEVAKKWDDYELELQNKKIQRTKLDVQINLLESECRKLSKKTRGLAKLEIL